MLINLGYRVVSYVAAPVVDQAALYVNEQIDSIPEDTRRRWVLRLAQGLRPLVYAIDYLRLGLVGLYVRNRKCLRTLQASLSDLNSMTYDGKLPASPTPVAWTPSDAAEKHTVQPLFPVLLILSPLFFLADFMRSVLCDYLHPQFHSRSQAVLDTVWALQYGSVVIT